MLRMLGKNFLKISTDDILKCFSFFSKKTGFDISCKLPPFNKKTIINLSSAQFGQRVVKVKVNGYIWQVFCYF